MHESGKLAQLLLTGSPLQLGSQLQVRALVPGSTDDALSLGGAALLVAVLGGAPAVDSCICATLLLPATTHA